MEHLPPVGWGDVVTKDTLRYEITGLRQDMNHRFDLMDHRFDLVDQRFDLVDQRFEDVDQRFQRLEKTMDQRFEGVDKRFEGLEEKFEGLANVLRVEFYRGLNRQLFSLVTANIAMFTLFLGAVKFL